MSDQIRKFIDYDPLTGSFTRKFGKGGNGGKDVRGYIRLYVGGKRYYGHWLAWWFVHGEWPKRALDHINGNMADNRIANLRLATKQQNAANSKKKRTGLKGAHWHKGAKKWVAQIRCHPKFYYLGLFETEAEAHAAYCRAAAELHGEFARFE